MPEVAAATRLVKVRAKVRVEARMAAERQPKQRQRMELPRQRLGQRMELPRWRWQSQEG